MAGILIRAALEANEGNWEAIHDSRKSCSDRGLVLGSEVGIGWDSSG